MRQRGWRSLTPGISVAAVSSTIGIRLATTFLSFLAGIIAARELGEHGRGTLALLVAVPAAFSVVGVIGLDTANLRFAGRSHTAFLHIVRLAVLFSLVIGTAISGAWLLAGSRWPVVRFGLSPGLALLSAMLCPIVVLVTLLGAAEVGRGRIQVYNLVTAAAMAVYLAAIAVLSVTGPLTVVKCFLSYGTSQVLGVVAFLVLASDRMHGDGERVPLREYRSYSLRAYLPNIAQYGMLRMDVPVIQVLAGTTAVGLYAVALPFAEAMLLLPIAVSLVMFPRVTAGTLSRAATAQISRTVLAGTAALAGAVALAAPVIVPTVYGTPFRGSVAVIWCMLPGAIVFSAGRTVQTYLAATDRLRPVITASVGGIAAGFVSLIVLTPRFGAAGAGAADSVGYFAYAAVITGCLRRDGPLIRATTSMLYYCFRATPQKIGAVGGLARLTAFGCVVAVSVLAAATLSTANTVTVITALGVLALLIALAVPSAGLYILAIAISASQTIFAGHVITSRALLVLTAVCIMGHFAVGRIVRPKIVTMTLATASVIYFLLSSLFVGQPGSTGGDVRSVLVLAVVLLGVPLIAGTGRVARQTILVFCFSSAIFAVAEIVTARASVASLGAVTPLYAASLAAAQTGALNHNIEGALFVLALAVLLAWLPQCRHGLPKVCTVAAIAALLAGVAYSFSRASFLGAVAVLILFAMRRSIRGLVGLAAVIGAALPLIPTTVAARLGTITNAAGLDPSSAVRLDLWESAARMFTAHPVFGVGYLHFAAQLPSYYLATGTYSISLIDFSDLDYAHNFYFSVPAETGLLGTLLVGALIVAVWRIMWSAIRSRDWIGEATLLAFVGLAVCSVFGEVLFQAAILAAFLLIALAGRCTEGST
jgi:O-antigen/teichoic acid export membrane protein/O-antigen ligase